METAASPQGAIVLPDNFRGGDGNVGIIRSPVRAIALPDYFQPVFEEFQQRTMWSLSNAFTSAFKELEPIPQYKATAKLAGFLQAVRPS